MTDALVIVNAPRLPSSPRPSMLLSFAVHVSKNNNGSELASSRAEPGQGCWCISANDSHASDCQGCSHKWLGFPSIHMDQS